MKRLVFCLIVLFLIMTVAQSQAQVSKKEAKKEVRVEKKQERKALRKLEGKVTSKFVKSTFYADFGNVPNVRFVRRDFMDEATFIKDGQETTAYYDARGQLVGTTSVVPFSKVPLQGQQKIKKMYAGYTIGDVIFFDDNEANDTDMLLYGVQFDDADNYFVQLTKGNKKKVVQVNPEGEVFFFKDL